MRTGWRWTLVKFTTFAVVMIVMTAFLFFIFGNYRTGSNIGYSALFTDVSRLKPGDTVRVAGIRVGTVNGVSMRADKKVVVTFDTDRNVALTTGTRAMVRYLNLIGDRYLELIDGPGPIKVLPAGAQISVDHTAPALDLDLLLGGLKPVIQGLNPQDVNALSASIIQIVQGQEGTIESLFSKTSSFTNALADHTQVIQELIDNLRKLLATLSKEGTNFSDSVDRLEKLVTQLSADRDPIGDAVVQLNIGTASIADLLTQARPPLAANVDELNKLAPNLDAKKDRIDTALQKAPENYRKLTRIGSYGSFVNYYICNLWVRVSDLSGRTAVFPAITQEGGRCADP